MWLWDQNDFEPKPAVLLERGSEGCAAFFASRFALFDKPFMMLCLAAPPRKDLSNVFVGELLLHTLLPRWRPLTQFLGILLAFGLSWCR